jgi:hypothetical protein
LKIANKAHRELSFRRGVRAAGYDDTLSSTSPDAGEE